MSKMKFLKPKKKEAPISDETFELRKLDIYRQYWEGLREFRDKRERAAKFFNGDQWFESTLNDDGEWVSEERNIMSLGAPPIKQNIIKPVIRSLVGQHRGNSSKSVVVARTPEKSKESEMLSNALQYNLQSVNKSKELDARALEEFLISGVAIQEIVWRYVPELKREEAQIYNRNPNSMFFNNDIEDIEGRDIRVIGRLIDYTMDELIVNFGSTPEREKKLRDIYGSDLSDYVDAMAMEDRQYLRDFYVPFDISKCRVIVAWEKRLVKQMKVHDWMDGREFYCDWDQKKLDQANNYRISEYAKLGTPAEDVLPLEGEIMNVQKMFYAYYSPYGHVLREGETPFEHGSHPFITIAYPLLDGNITGIATDLIPTQKQVNRIFVLQDMITSSSIKNSLVVDTNSLKGTSLEEVGEQHKKIGGVIGLDLGGNAKVPIELKGSSNNLGNLEWIQMYLQMNQEVSGVSTAMKGQTAASGTSGKLYDAQINQSSLNSKDVMETFSGAFCTDRDMKLLKTIQQYYKEPRMLAIAGKSYTETAILYDPDRVMDMDFDLTIGQTSDSPIYRTIIEDTLTKFVDQNKITLKQWAQQTTLPFASSFLDMLRKDEEEQAKLQQQQGMIPQQGVDPNAQQQQQQQAVA